MATIPAGFNRVPTLLSSQLILSSVTRNQVDLFNIQQQISSGKQVSTSSDDPVAAAVISAIKDRIGRGDQRARNIQHAQTVINTLDDSLTQATDLTRSAQTIAISQIGLTSDATTRQQQAVVVDSLIKQLQTIANRQTAGVYLFGGSTPTVQPITELNGGYRYGSRGSGLITDLGTGDLIPITVGGDNAIGETSGRLRSAGNLNPNLAADAKLTDIRGARGLGVAPGSVQFSFNGGASVRVDLAGAQTIADVQNRLTVAIRDYEAANSVTVLGGGGITTSGGAINVDIAAGGSLVIGETANGTTAADLGLNAAAFTTAAPAGLSLDPKLTLNSRLGDIPGVTVPLGKIRLNLSSNAGSTGGSVVREVDLSTATTIDDVRNLIESSGIGVRVQISASGRGIDLLNEVSGPALSVEEVTGNNLTATQLGIRTFSSTTSIADFNDGRGVRVANGATDPITGLPNPAGDRDFRITLGNGQAFDVDLRPEDLVNVQSVLARINAQFATAVGQPPVNGSAPALTAADFTAQLVDGPNGIALLQNVAGGAISVSKLNNSDAADDLGLLNGTYSGATSTLVAQDRATIRVQNLFTNLLDLAAALRRNDSAGISIAGQNIQTAADRLSAAHAVVGSSSQRISQAADDLENTQILDEQLRSQLEDLDLASAASRFSLLNTQYEASLRTAGQIASTRTLLDFLT